MEYYEALQKLVNNDDFTKSLNFTVHDMSKDYVRLEAEVTDAHRNGYGALHGGYLMALADCAAGYAAFTDGRHYVTQSSHMSFLKNVSSGKIFANARVLKRGRLVSVVRVEIFSGEECLLCEGSFNCYCIEPGESGKVPITRVKSNTECDVNYYAWGGARISHILRNPFYKGAHLVCRTHQKGIRSNTYDIIPREDWEIIEDCHEAIVSPEEWEQVQSIIDRRPTIMKGNSCPFYNLFHGIIYCATCGKSMQVRYEKVGRTGKNRFTGEMREPIDKAYYICQTYNRLGKNACTSHKIEARDLYDLVLKDIQELAAQALKDADAFYQRLSSRMERRYLIDASQTQKERQRLEARNQEIDGMFLSLYTDKAKGILTEQRFMKLTAALEQEQEANQKRLQDLMLMMRHSDEQESEVRTFIREIRRYAAIEELDEAVLNRLISKILVGEVKKIDGQKVQEVRIIYNFVGEIPEITE